MAQARRANQEIAYVSAEDVDEQADRKHPTCALPAGCELHGMVVQELPDADCTSNEGLWIGCGFSPHLEAELAVEFLGPPRAPACFVPHIRGHCPGHGGVTPRHDPPKTNKQEK